MTAGATPPAAPARPAAGAIYDLGYARYAGDRQSPAKLWRVIMRQQLTHSWKTIWRFKLWMFVAIVTTVVCGAFMYLRRTETVQAFAGAGAPVQILDEVLFWGFRVYLFCGFVVTMTVAASLVARDQETGAFTFYFARPVRARDYVVGKLAAVALLMSTIFLAGPLALAGLRLALAQDTADLMALLDWLPKIAVVGVLATATFTALPLAVSSLAPRRTLALGLWAAYYVMFTTMVAGIGMLTWKPLVAVDPAIAVLSLLIGLLDFRFAGYEPIAPTWAAVVSLVGQSLIAIAIFYRRIEAQSLGSVGGSS